MYKPMQSHSAARKNAEHYFKQVEQPPDAAGRPTHEGERKAGAMNTLKLRKPRLAMPAVEKNATDNPPTENGAAEPALQRKRAPAVRSILRMNY
jgi:hypothetical protein